MWFMYTLIGLYLIAPIISPWLGQINRKGIELVLAFWIITLLYPIISLFINVNEAHSGILYYFGGYAGYFFLGYYFRRYLHNTSFLLPLMIVVPVTCCGIAYYYGFEGDFYLYFWYLSIFVAMMAAGWFMLIKNMVSSDIEHRHGIIPTISNLCFGVYLSHIIIMREILWKIDFLQDIECVASIVAITLLTFVLSLLLSWGLAISPVGKYIVGYRIKKQIPYKN